MLHYLIADRAEFRRCATAFGILQHMASVELLEKINEQKAQPSPIVIMDSDFYAPDDSLRSDFASTLVQPTGSMMDWLGERANPSDTVERLVRVLGSSYLKVCLDLTHWDLPSNNGIALPNWELAFPMLIKSGIVGEIHIGPNRDDFTDDGGEQLKKIVRDKIDKTDLGVKLEHLKHSLPEDQVFPPCVIEMTAKQALAAKKPQLHRDRQKSDRVEDLKQVHAATVAAVAEMIK